MITTNLELDKEITKKELCELLGIKKANGGRNVKLQDEEIARYIKVEKVSRYKIKVTEIYKNAAEKIDNRGHSEGSRNNNNPYGQYIDKLLKEYIATEEKEDFYATTNILAQRVGLININYSFCSRNKNKYFQHSYSEVYADANKTAMWDIFGIIKGVLKGATHSALCRLEKTGAISFQEAYILINCNSKRIANLKETNIIKECESEILVDLKTTKQKMQFNDKLRNKFYSEVEKLVEQRIDNVTSFFVGYKIHKLVYMKSELSKEKIIELREDVNQLFKSRVRSSMVKVHKKSETQLDLVHIKTIGKFNPNIDKWTKNRINITYMTYSDYCIDSLISLKYKIITDDVEHTNIIEFFEVEVEENPIKFEKLSKEDIKSMYDRCTDEETRQVLEDFHGIYPTELPY